MRILLSSEAISSRFSRSVIFTPCEVSLAEGSEEISISSRTLLTMVFGTMPWASL